jgi:hypothetical protein
LISAETAFGKDEMCSHFRVIISAFISAFRMVLMLAIRTIICAVSASLRTCTITSEAIHPDQTKGAVT